MDDGRHQLAAFPPDLAVTDDQPVPGQGAQHAPPDEALALEHGVVRVEGVLDSLGCVADEHVLGENPGPDEVVVECPSAHIPSRFLRAAMMRCQVEGSSAKRGG
jgi:hypothetical protein